MEGHGLFTFVTPELVERLVLHGQQHLLDGVTELDPKPREQFLDRLAAVDWDELAAPPQPPAAGEVGASRVVSIDEQNRLRSELGAAGEHAYRAGRVAVLMVAGGQGTRLGFPGAKGCFPIAPHSRKSIYQLHAEKVLSLSRRVGCPVPLLVMTSPATDSETRRFFDSHGLFGLEREQVRFFVQGTVPSLDRERRALLERPGRLLENPDGHGGAFSALTTTGNLDLLREEDTTHLVYIQVDNVLAPIDDAVLVGLALVERADVVTKVLAKAHPDEKVGNLVRVGARDRIVEYTELTPEATRARMPDGTLVYRWGSPAMHCWRIGFLARLAERGFRLPLHATAKPLSAWLGGEVREVSGWKHERFIFDLVAQADRSIGMEVDRAAEFAPVKNASGPDSPATAVELAHRQYVKWLKAAGVTVSLPPDARIEISPLLAARREQFLERWDGRLRRVTGHCYLGA